MEISNEKRKTDDIEKVKNYLLEQGFVCSSHQSSQNLIYSKNSETVIIKNNKK